VPEGERHWPLLETRQVITAEDADYPRRVSERRDGREELGLDRLAGDEQVDRLDPGPPRGIDEVLALTDEEPQLRALPPALQLADELQARIRGGGDQCQTLLTSPSLAAQQVSDT
jgi:hypothetical protein